MKDSGTEERILEAAKEVFMMYGLYGARMQDIADKANINKALLHYYFRNKEKLFDAVFDGALSKYFEQMTIFGETSLPIEQRIYTYIDGMFEFLSEYPQMSMFIIKEISINPELFHQKVASMKIYKGPTLIPALMESMNKKEIPEIDPLVFLLNLHSLCTYPFLASPIFKTIVAKSKLEWKDENHLKIKHSVKEFVAFRLQKTLN
ncbi:MAG: TetR/AcrR family transcriptional regulator [Fluviicola sp.]|nr:TetR/AcrR family transcriptional regulator [Fluviicola sp.]